MSRFRWSPASPPVTRSPGQPPPCYLDEVTPDQLITGGAKRLDSVPNVVDEHRQGPVIVHGMGDHIWAGVARAQGIFTRLLLLRLDRVLG